jgi:TPR repeat protein
MLARGNEMPSYLRRTLLSTFTVFCVCVLSAAADFETGKRAYAQGEYATAIKEFSALAQQGNADAQVYLGKMYMKGQGVAKDPSQAMNWYKTAAEQGNAVGQFFLGSMYLMNAQLRDTAQALKWLQLSASQGMPDAQVLLGMTYMSSPDVPRDLVRADMWLQLAAVQGDPFASAKRAEAERQMTADQIAKAQALVAAWKPKTSP